MEQKLLSQGAEAKIFLKEDVIVKDRFSKSYRIPEIDLSLRKSRTRREAKVFQKLKELKIPCPELIDFDDKDMKISMKFLDGPKLRDIFHNSPDKFSSEIGKLLGILHSNDIIHADLTTSNMIFFKDKIHLIDFGLSFFSKKVEDMAVDLHLLFRALESKHHEFFKEAKQSVLNSYKKSNPDYEKVFERLLAVESRGRHKKKTK